jgi:hypothetical protein
VSCKAKLPSHHLSNHCFDIERRRRALGNTERHAQGDERIDAAGAAPLAELSISRSILLNLRIRCCHRQYRMIAVPQLAFFDQALKHINGGTKILETLAVGRERNVAADCI